MFHDAQMSASVSGDFTESSNAMTTRRTTSRRIAVSNRPDNKISAAASSRLTPPTARPTATSTQPDTTKPSLPHRSPKTRNELKKARGLNSTPSKSEYRSFDEFAKVFNDIYQRFYKSHKVSPEDIQEISARVVELHEFERLTECKQYARYISLMDGRIIFHEIPNAPHGQIIDCLVFSISSQIDRTKFMGAADNGRIPQILSLLCRLYLRYTSREPV